MPPERHSLELTLSDQIHSGASAPACSNAAAPSADGGRLQVTLETGAAFSLPAERLRAGCRCAHCRRAQIDGVFPEQFPSVTIAHVVPVGHYAVNLEFSDGHARGIYPWPYLAELAADLLP
ncbi:MAG TPA: DUF971 domain-containing protein [Xanthobacteraceae bacterium]|nr:DUF971 domain-containing protein [Xanthobacteraceae bacterium]